jgi:hypothetical protein
MKNFLVVTEHPVERVTRVLVGVVVSSLLSSLGRRLPGAWLGLVPILTGATGLCPLYTVLGIIHLP